MNVQVKESLATLETKAEYLRLLKSEARLEFVKAKIRWADKGLDILRTKAANARMEWNQSGLPERRN